jgi:glycosyltransferase involved in cell wall biosynthesis
MSHRVPARIVACADSARDIHIGLGYDASRMVVIPNGFEVPHPAPPAETAPLRSALGIPPGRQVVVRIARYHPQKDYPTLLAAAGTVVANGADVHLVLAGLDVIASNVELVRLLRQHGLEGRTTLLGLHSRPQDLLAVADVAVSSSSYGEAFPLVIGEAMAAGVPVATTDVGDSARLLGPDAGLVVPPGDPAALADAVLALLRAPASARAAMADAARRRVTEEFSLTTMVDRYQSLWAELPKGRAGRG